MFDNVNPNIAKAGVLQSHVGPKGRHTLWDSRLFDYAKPEVLHFLLSNCLFWLHEFHVDGFRFDGVTSILYSHHRLSKAFTSYEDYFDASVDDEALAYLVLANRVIHQERLDFSLGGRGHLRSHAH